MSLTHERTGYLRALLRAAASVAALALAAPSLAAPDGNALRRLAAQDLRLATIGHRLARANVELCTERTMLTGLILHDLTEYDAALRPVVADTFSLGSGIGISGVVRGAAGDRAGLKADDEILAVDGIAVGYRPDEADSRGSYSRIDQFSSLLQHALHSSPVRLSIRRGDAMRQVMLNGEPGCASQFNLTPSTALNAWSDGDYVVVTTAMADFAERDDELAFVVAHELSHNILTPAEERDEPGGLLAAFGIGAGSIRADEIRADVYAVRLMRTAGFNPLNAVPFLKRSAKRIGSGVTATHPGVERRIGALITAAADLEQRSASVDAVSVLASISPQRADKP
jgi:PDZ domain-containing protein/peptidase M48-like protein